MRGRGMAESSDGLTRGQRSILAAIFVAGLATTWFAVSSIESEARERGVAAAQSEAERLTATFGLLLGSAQAPLQSLATLFNGSGRVAAEEFTDTIAALEKQAGPLFPSALAFITRSNPAGCEDPEGCWLVAYSTAIEGLLSPGTDMSRFAPTATTITSALADEGAYTIGPPFREANGEHRSFLAVTIRNTRQFGVLVSTVDYAAVVRRLDEIWIPEGLGLRIDAAFPQDGRMSEPITLYGNAGDAKGFAHMVTAPIESDGARFTLHWNVEPGFLERDSDPVVVAAGLAGLFATLLVAFMAAIAMRRKT
jgi:hypothetical protein